MKPTLLMLTHRAPFAPDRGDRIRAYHLLRTLSRDFDIDLASTDEHRLTPEQLEVLAGMTRRRVVARVSPVQRHLRAASALVRGDAITPACWYDPQLHEQVRRWHHDQPYDALLVFCSGMVRYARGLAVRRRVLDLLDVDSQKWASYATLRRPPLRWVYGAEARRLRGVERGDYEPFDAVAVISPREAEVYRQHVGGTMPLHVIGNGVDLATFAPRPDAGGRVLTFVGVLDYWPNVDGLCWFVSDVLPQVRRTMPDVRLRIVGRHVSAAVRRLAGVEGVELVGEVPDVRPELARATVVIAPLRLARGVQNKVLEAMSAGRAVLCTSQVAAGINATDGQHFAVADAPQQWVRRIEWLLNDVTTRTTMARRARQCVEQRYTWAAQLAPMRTLLGTDAKDAALRHAA